MTSQSKALKSNADSKLRKGIKYYKKTGFFKTRGKVRAGSGHDAGYNWGQQKGIDPTSRVRRYSKNSPSFDEGVFKYKENARNRALESMKK